MLLAVTGHVLLPFVGHHITNLHLQPMDLMSYITFLIIVWSLSVPLQQWVKCSYHITRWMVVFNFTTVTPKGCVLLLPTSTLLHVDTMKKEWLIQTSNLRVYLLLNCRFLVFAQFNFGHFSGFVYEYCERVHIYIVPRGN